ncbi:MAG: site-specific integrase, partial [Candidatus Riflebacteria bacterium]|nr:site-specific integrase [Candidatus Riflebacteria bacterium]
QNSFEALAQEWFALNSSKFSAGHGKVIMDRLARDVMPWLGKTPVSDIKPTEILSALRRVESRGAVEIAHRLRGYISKVVCYAIATGRATSDPTRDLKGALKPMLDTKHRAALTDPKRFGDLLCAMDLYRGSLVVKSAMKLAALTAVRPGELRHAEWNDIDLDTAEWRYLVTKTNTPHIVPLSRQAVEILKELQPLTGHGRYVFPNPRTPDGSRAMSEAAVLVALRTMGFTNEEMTGHGFRAVFRTLGDEVLRFRIDLIEHQLAHTVRDPLGRAYNRTTHLEERKKMMQQWADYLDSLR